MPTLNEYADEDGYYILARPSDTGNITYQLKPRGEQIVEKVGHQDGEEIGWQVISALKVPNLVYTGDEGATDDDMSVDLSKEEIDALSEKDARQLLGELSSVPRVGDSQTEEIGEILGVSFESEHDLDEVADAVEQSFREQGITDGRIPGVIGDEILDNNDIFAVGVDIRGTEEGKQKNIHFEIAVFGELGDQFEGDTFNTVIGIREDEGIVSIVTQADEKITLKLVKEYQKLMADMLPIVVSELESAGLNAGSPESLPALKVTSKD